MAAIRSIGALLPRLRSRSPLKATVRLFSAPIGPSGEGEAAAAAAAAAADEASQGKQSIFIVHAEDVFEVVPLSQEGTVMDPKPECYNLRAPKGSAVLALRGDKITEDVPLSMRDMKVFMDTFGMPLPLPAGTNDGTLVLQVGVLQNASRGFYNLLVWKDEKFWLDTMKTFSLHCQKSSGTGLLQHNTNISKGAVFEDPVAEKVFKALQLRMDHFDKKDKLGKGGESTGVWKAKEKVDGEFVVLKMMMRQYLFNEPMECFISKTISSPLLRSVLGMWNEEVDGSMQTTIILEYKAMTLTDFLQSLPKFCLKKRLLMLLQACRALVVFHNADHAHRDFHLSNLFLDEDGMTVTLGDFGFVVRIVNKTFMKLDCHSGKSAEWVAPDMLTGSPTTKAEVYSVGHVMLFLLCKDLPGTIRENCRKFKKVLGPTTLNGRMKKFNDSIFAKSFHGDKNFLLRMFSNNSKDRPTPEEVIAWIQSFLDSLTDEEDEEDDKSD